MQFTLDNTNNMIYTMLCQKTKNKQTKEQNMTEKTNLPKYDPEKYNSWSAYYIELSNKILNS